MLSFCLVGYAVLDWFGGQGWVASPGMASFSSQGGWCRDGGGEGAGMSFQLCAWGREGQAERLHSSLELEHTRHVTDRDTHVSGSPMSVQPVLSAAVEPQ